MVLVNTAVGEVDDAVRAMKLGASLYGYGFDDWRYVLDKLREYYCGTGGAPTLREMMDQLLDRFDDYRQSCRTMGEQGRRLHREIKELEDAREALDALKVLKRALK